MPNPAIVLAGAQMLLGIGKSVAAHKGQQQQYRANRAAALENLRLQYRDLTIRGIEESMAAQQATDLAGLQAQQALGASRASAAASGVSGVSVEAQDRAIYGDLGAFRSSTALNLTLTLDQLERARAGAAAGAKAQIAGVERPSLLATALRIGGSALDAYGTYKAYKPPTPEN